MRNASTAIRTARWHKLIVQCTAITHCELWGRYYVVLQIGTSILSTALLAWVVFAVP